jgi:cytochrome c peroxidase
MHDGRLATLDDVIEFYSTGVHNTPYTDPLMKFAPQGGVQLNNIEKAQIKAFLLALTDSVFIYNPAYQDPGY